MTITRSLFTILTLPISPTHIDGSMTPSGKEATLCQTSLDFLNRICTAVARQSSTSRSCSSAATRTFWLNPSPECRGNSPWFSSGPILIRPPQPTTELGLLWSQLTERWWKGSVLYVLCVCVCLFVCCSLTSRVLQVFLCVA